MAMAEPTLAECIIYQQWKVMMTKPKTTGARVAVYFNHRVQTDLFTLWGRLYIILVGEAIRDCVCNDLSTRDSSTWLQVFLNVWVRYFGAPHVIVSDQEGAVISDLVGKACEAFDIDRDLQGSEERARTGIAERKLGIIKLAALNL